MCMCVSVCLSCVLYVCVYVTMYGSFQVISTRFWQHACQLVDFHFMSSSSSEGNITNVSINKVIVLISY